MMIYSGRKPLTVLVIMFLYPKNSFRFGYSMCSCFSSTLFTQKPVDTNCCKIWSLCVDNHIISMAENVFLPFPCNEQVFSTVYIFVEATIDEE